MALQLASMITKKFLSLHQLPANAATMEKLRFSKSGKMDIEKAYSTHFLNKYQIEKLKENKNILDENHD